MSESGRWLWAIRGVTRRTAGARLRVAAGALLFTRPEAGDDARLSARQHCALVPASLPWEPDRRPQLPRPAGCAPNACARGGGDPRGRTHQGLVTRSAAGRSVAGRRGKRRASRPGSCATRAGAGAHSCWGHLFAFRSPRRGGKRFGVPLYGCPECGWATTGSLPNAELAHQVVAPECGGEIEVVAEWALPDNQPARVAVRRGGRDDRSVPAGGPV